MSAGPALASPREVEWRVVVVRLPQALVTASRTTSGAENDFTAIKITSVADYTVGGTEKRSKLLYLRSQYGHSQILTG
jgi:hypothetical protein